MRAITFTRSGNTQFFKGKELVNWAEVCIFLFYWKLSPAFKTGFHFNFWATPALSVSPHDRFSNPSITLRALGWTRSFFVPGGPELGLAWSPWCWAEVKSHVPWPDTIPSTAQEAIGPLCCQGTRLPHAQLAQSTAELLSSQLAPASPAGWAHLSPHEGLGESLYRILQGSWTFPASPACWGPSEWQHNQMVHQLLLHISYPLQIRWGCTSHCPGH